MLHSYCSAKREGRNVVYRGQCERPQKLLARMVLRWVENETDAAEDGKWTPIAGDE